MTSSCSVPRRADGTRVHPARSSTSTEAGWWRRRVTGRCGCSRSRPRDAGGCRPPTGREAFATSPAIGSGRDYGSIGGGRDRASRHRRGRVFHARPARAPRTLAVGRSRPEPRDGARARDAPPSSRAGSSDRTPSLAAVGAHEPGRSRGAQARRLPAALHADPVARRGVGVGRSRHPARARVRERDPQEARRRSAAGRGRVDRRGHLHPHGDGAVGGEGAPVAPRRRRGGGGGGGVRRARTAEPPREHVHAPPSTPFVKGLRASGHDPAAGAAPSGLRPRRRWGPGVDCAASRRAGSRCRTRRRRSSSVRSIPNPATACSTRAPRRAARPRTPRASSVRPGESSPGTSDPSGRPSSGAPRNGSASPSSSWRRTRTHPAIDGTVRPGARGRAVLGHRVGAPATRAALATSTRRALLARATPGGDRVRRRRPAASRRPAGLLGVHVPARRDGRRLRRAGHAIGPTWNPWRSTVRTAVLPGFGCGRIGTAPTACSSPPSASRP